MRQQDLGVSRSVYRYTHRCEGGTNIHDVFVEKSVFRVLFSYIGAALLLASVCRALLSKETLCLGSFWSVSFSAIIAKWLQYKPMKKESLIIMPAFGIQLEQHFWSGRVHRQFVPISKILKPMLNECVTPVTCYWSLALLLHDADELMLVFKATLAHFQLILKCSLMDPWSKELHICRNCIHHSKCWSQYGKLCAHSPTPTAPALP